MDPVFWRLHSGLAHEAPGSRSDTLRALDLAGVSGRARVLDVASGPGAASLALLGALPQAHVTATDLHMPFLADAGARVAAAGHGPRFASVVADMARLPFAPGSFDLIWCEGAAYVMGVPAALADWPRLLAPGGRLAFSEAVWMRPAPHPRARALWTEYPAMADVAGVRGWIAAAGLRTVGDFVLSQDAWRAYYDPLAARLDGLEAELGARHPVLAAGREEIEVWRAHGADFGYAFFVVAR